MADQQSPEGQHQQFAHHVANCGFFDETGMLDLERFCVHLHLCLFCDGAPTPDPVALYVLMLQRVTEARSRVSQQHIRKQKVDNWDDSLLSYYPDKEVTRMHFDALGVVYPAWIRQVGVELLEHRNADGAAGRFWVKPEWWFTSKYLNRFEAELLRIGGLGKILGGDGMRLN